MRSDLDTTGETTLVGCQLSIVFYSNKSHFRCIALQILEQGNNKMKEVFSKKVNLVAMLRKCLFCFLLLSLSHLRSLQRPLIFLLKCHSGLFVSFHFYSHHNNPKLCQELLKDRKTGKRTPN